MWKIQISEKKNPPIAAYVYKSTILMIDAKCLLVDCHSKGHNATAIWDKLRAQFHDEALAYSSVTNWLRRPGFREDIREPGGHRGKLSDGLIDLQILIELTEFPFHSVRTLARAPKIPRSMVWDHLQKGPFVVKHLRWVPPTLDAVERRTWVTMSDGLLKDLEQAGHQVGVTS
jgi:hypothetical protein